MPEAAAKVVDDGGSFESRAPTLELGDVARDDGFGARNFRFAGAAVLLDDLAQVVDVVEVQAVEPCGAGIDVARHTQVNDEDGPAFAARESLVEHFARKHH